MTNNINYEAAFNHAEYWRKKIIPHLQHVTEAITFQDYLTGIYKSKTSYKTFGLPVPYIFSLDFLKRFQEKCLTFQYNSPKDVQEGAAPISCIFQFSRSLHGMANISLWHEEADDKSDSHITLFLVYEKLEEALDFIDSNLDITKRKEEEKGAGFAFKENLKKK